MKKKKGPAVKKSKVEVLHRVDGRVVRSRTLDVSVKRTRQEEGGSTTTHTRPFPGLAMGIGRRVMR